ncbi:MAG: hydrogenase maturation protease [Bacteroidales bacterium]
MTPTALEDIFKSGNGHILIIGIGNQLRSDDGAGPRIIDKLHPSTAVSLLNAETNIERYITPIKESGAGLLLFIDCMSFGKPPGYCGLLPIDLIRDYTFHSHNISLNRIRDFFDTPAFVLGIEPASLKVGEHLSENVRKSVESLIAQLNQYIRDYAP